MPKFETQGSLFESLGSIAPQLFDQQDRYKLFALKIWPVLSGCREELAQCYDQGNGRPGVEPVVCYWEYRFFNFWNASWIVSRSRWLNTIWGGSWRSI
jgi:hypothetical protein